MPAETRLSRISGVSPIASSSDSCTVIGSRLGPLCRRTGRDHLAIDPRAIAIVVHRVVPCRQVIPQYEIAWFPAESDGVVGRRGVRKKVWKDDLSLCGCDAGQPDRRGTDEEAPAAGVTMLEHHRMLDGLLDLVPLAALRIVVRVGVINRLD